MRAYHELFAMKRKFSGGVKGERYTNRNCSFSRLKNILSGNPVISFDDILLKIEEKTVFIVFFIRGIINGGICTPLVLFLVFISETDSIPKRSRMW